MALRSFKGKLFEAPPDLVVCSCAERRTSTKLAHYLDGIVLEYGRTYEI